MEPIVISAERGHDRRVFTGMLLREDELHKFSVDPPPAKDKVLFALEGRITVSNPVGAVKLFSLDVPDSGHLLYVELEGCESQVPSLVAQTNILTESSPKGGSVFSSGSISSVSSPSVSWHRGQSAMGATGGAVSSTNGFVVASG